MTARRRRKAKLHTLPNEDRSMGMHILRGSIARVDSGEAPGGIIIERIPGERNAVRMGWWGVVNTYELVGLLEQVKLRLLAGEDGDK